MSTVTEPKPQAPTLITRRTMVIGAIAVVVVAAIALDTKVVQIGSEHDVRKAVFSP
jgi:hypothetical protein